MHWPTVSLITFCKGRLHHLRQSLPYSLAQNYPGDWDVTVVDYGCPDGSFEFVQELSRVHPRLKAIRVGDNVERFNMSRARNIGANYASGEILAFVDADHMPIPDFLSQGIRKMVDNGLNRANPGDAEGVFGDCFVRSSTFQRLRGYDEAFEGWGWDDIDFYNRALAGGEQTVLIPRNSVNLIHHENDDRVKYYDNKDIQQSSMDNYRRSQVPNRQVNPHGFGITQTHELLNLGPVDAWQRINQRYPWAAHRPLLPFDGHGWLGQGNVQLLSEWIGSHAPRMILEVGSWLGRSTRFFLEAAPEARVVALDHWSAELVDPILLPNPTLATRLLPQFMANCWESRARLALCQNDSVCGLKELAGLGLNPDLIYIDGDHRRESVQADLRMASTRFPEATLSGDDWNWTDSDGPTVQPAVQALAQQRSLRLEVNGECWLLTHA